MENHVESSGKTKTTIPHNRCMRSKTESSINKFVKDLAKSSLFCLFTKKTMLIKLVKIPITETELSRVTKTNWKMQIDDHNKL